MPIFNPMNELRTGMKDSQPSEIDIFDSSYVVDSAGNIHLTHTISADEAVEIERHITEATNLQDAIRRLSSAALAERRETLRVSQFEEQAAAVAELAACSEEMLTKLETIASAVDE